MKDAGKTICYWRVLGTHSSRKGQTGQVLCMKIMFFGLVPLSFELLPSLN